MSTSTLQDLNSTKTGDICENVMITNAASNTVPMSIQALITAVQELDASLGNILNLLARLKRGKPIVIRWLTIDERFRASLSASKLAASSMTVFLSEYKNVILESIASGKVSPETLKAEIASLTRNVEGRRSELTSDQKQSTMQDLCKDLVVLLFDTQSELNRQAATVEKQASGLLARLTQLDGQLHKWTSKRSKLDWTLPEKMDFGPFVCAPVAIMLNTEAVENAQTVCASEVGVPSTAGHDVQNVAQILKTPDNNERAHPDLALKTDLIADTYTLFLLELKGLTAMLDQLESVSRNESFHQRLAAVSNLHGSLIQMFDLYSKQALFSERGNMPNKVSLVHRGTASLRRPFSCFLCGSHLFHPRMY